MQHRLIGYAMIMLLMGGCGLQKGGAVRQDFADFGGNLRRMASSKGVKVPTSLSNEEVANSEYGYVVGAVNGRNEWVHTSKSYKDSLDKYEIVELPFSNRSGNPFSKKTGYSYDVYQLKPGRYTLVYYGLPSGYRSIDPDKDQNELIKATSSVYASFEVKAGEITYIGDIEIFDSNSMNINEYSGFAIMYLKEHYKNLTDVSDLLKVKLAEKGRNFNN